MLKNIVRFPVSC